MVYINYFGYFLMSMFLTQLYATFKMNGEVKKCFALSVNSND